MPRAVVTALAAVAVLGCGGDSNEPRAIFPDVAGTYQVDGGFDDRTPEMGSFTGTLTLEQASLEESPLTGSADLTVNLEGDVFTVEADELVTAAVDLGGVVSFTIERPSQGLTWEFEGERAGDVIEGRHTLTDGGQTISGDWIADRSS